MHKDDQEGDGNSQSPLTWRKGSQESQTYK